MKKNIIAHSAAVTLTGRGIFFPVFPPEDGFLVLLVPPPTPLPDFPIGRGVGPGAEGFFFDFDPPLATVGRDDEGVDGDGAFGCLLDFPPAPSLGLVRGDLCDFELFFPGCGCGTVGTG